MSTRVDVDQLIADLETGDRSAVRALQARIDAADGAVEVDALAASAAGGSQIALDTLLDVMVRHRMSEPAIRRYTFDPELIADAHQETLIAVGRAIGTFRGDAAFSTWLFRVATNATIGLLRRVPATGELEEDHGAHARYVSSMIATRATLGEAIGRLEEPYRSAVVMRDVEQLPYQRIAELTGANLNTVKSWIARGRAMVAQQIGDARES